MDGSPTEGRSDEWMGCSQILFYSFHLTVADYSRNPVGAESSKNGVSEVNIKILFSRLNL